LTEINHQDVEVAYKNLIAFYFEVKELIAAAEREDGKQRISISAIAELRSTLDHIMRAQSVEYGLVSEEEIRANSGLDGKTYRRKNYDKAYAHLYRSGYDAYDCISISLMDRIKNILNGISRQALYSVLPEAARSVATPYNEAKNLFTFAKVTKDVESHDQEKKQYQMYEQANKQLCDILDLLTKNESHMIEYDKELKKNTFKQRLFVVMVSSITFIVGFVIRTYWFH